VGRGLTVKRSINDSGGVKTKILARLLEVQSDAAVTLFVAVSVKNA
jgi:hypothetical protein